MWLRRFVSGVKVLLVERRRKKLDECAFESALHEMTLCLTVPCEVLVISEVLALIQWVWAFV